MLAVPGAAVPGATIILNKYNAVEADQVLKDGGYDAAFGPVPVAGNGGPWFELLVCGANPTSNRVADTTVDMRGWRLAWSSKATKAQAALDPAPTPGPDGKVRRERLGGTITLTSDPFWQNVRSGTILTFTKFDQAHGGADTNTAFAPALKQWHVNIWAGDARYVASGGEVMDTNNRDWQMTIKDSLGTVIFGPAGEGISAKHFVGKNEVCKLEEIEPRNIDPTTASYGGGGSSNFGAPNLWSKGAFAQDHTLLRGWSQPGVVISWQDWRDYWFQDADLLAGKGDPDADPVNSGLSNLIKAALGLNPHAADAQLAPTGMVTKASDGHYYMTMSVNLPPTQVEGITYDVETSPDGKTWSDQGTVMVINTASKLVVRDDVQINPRSKQARFIKLSVQGTEPSVLNSQTAPGQ